MRDNSERCVGSFKFTVIRVLHSREMVNNGTRRAFFQITFLEIAVYRLVKAHLSYNIISLNRKLSVKRARAFTSMRIRKPILHYCRQQRNLTLMLLLNVLSTTILVDRKFSPGKATLKGKPFQVCGRRGDLMVSALDSGSGGPGSKQGHCVVFLGKILYSHSASLHPGV